MSAKGFGNLVELLRTRADELAERPAYTFLIEGETEGETLSYAELERRARAIGAQLQSFLDPGERALLVYPPGLDFMIAFLGCLYAGVLAVPVHAPNPARPERTLDRLKSLARDADPAVVLTTSRLLGRLQPLRSASAELEEPPWLASEAIDPSQASIWRERPIAGSDLAMLQYTSGSTSEPKGVMVTHANLLNNVEYIDRAGGYPPGTNTLNWLPTFHDMGLIGGSLHPLYNGARCWVMSPAAFLQRPLRWLQAIARHRVFASAGPSSAYELCLRKIAPEERDRLDLSCWQVAINGAEPIRADTLERFIEFFGPCGFSRGTFFPCYGLAEGTLMVTGGPRRSGPVLRAVGDGQRHLGSRNLVGCGQPNRDTQVLIVDPTSGRICAEGQVGEVWVQGPSVAQGYWRRPEDSERTFGARVPAADGSFLRTGDLGLLEHGELFITGRLKDLIIIRGQNHYPHDLELTVESAHPALRPGGATAFSIEIEDEERLVIAAEVERRLEADLGPALVEAIASSAREAVTRRHEVQLHGLVLLKAGDLPKTSSGKHQRRACRQHYLAGALPALAEWRAPLEQRTESGRAKNLRRVRIRLALGGAAAEQRRGLLVEFLRDELASALRLPPARLEPDQSLTRMGVDSLLALDLRGRLEATFGVAPTPARMLNSANLDDLAAELDRLLETQGEGPGLAGEQAAQLLSNLDHLSDGEVDLLLTTLARERRP
jgi:acyl-CoA synthetase (AMP-forming)/AMP-acid ligase II/acyl carrier protein